MMWPWCCCNSDPSSSDPSSSGSSGDPPPSSDNPPPSSDNPPPSSGSSGSSGSGGGGFGICPGCPIDTPPSSVTVVFPSIPNFYTPFQGSHTLPQQSACAWQKRWVSNGSEYRVTFLILANGNRGLVFVGPYPIGTEVVDGLYESLIFTGYSFTGTCIPPFPVYNDYADMTLTVT